MRPVYRNMTLLRMLLGILSKCGVAAEQEEDGNGVVDGYATENRDIRYNVLRAVGYYKGKPVAEDLILLNGLEQAPNFELLYQDDKKILKGEAGYNYL